MKPPTKTILQNMRERVGNACPGDIDEMGDELLKMIDLVEELSNLHITDDDREWFVNDMGAGYIAAIGRIRMTIRKRLTDD